MCTKHCLLDVYILHKNNCLKKINNTTNENHWCRTDIGQDVAVAGY